MDKLFYCEGCIELEGINGVKKKNIGLILPTKPEDGGQHQYALLVVMCLLEKRDTAYNLIALDYYSVGSSHRHEIHHTHTYDPSHIKVYLWKRVEL